MLRWPVRSALYIDFENVPLPAEFIANWLAWLEDGIFEPGGRRRRFVSKRVYWNSHAERNRSVFEQHGFVPILIGKFSGLKNGADIRMAMDVIEATYMRGEIDEYILLTGDSDFVPVLERLREKNKRSAIVATEHRPNIHTTYQLHANVLIPSRRLTEANHYRRPRTGLLQRLGLRRPRSDEQAGDSRVTAAPAKAPPAARTAPRVRTAPPTPKDPLDMALAAVVKLLSQQPRNYVAQRRILAELDKVQGFKRRGAGAFLGRDSYRALMTELARRNPHIQVVAQPGEGTGVVYMPELAAAAGAPPTPPPPAAPPPPGDVGPEIGMLAAPAEASGDGGCPANSDIKPVAEAAQPTTSTKPVARPPTAAEPTPPGDAVPARPRADLETQSA